MIGPSQLPLDPPVVLLFQDPQPDLALDRPCLLSVHAAIFGSRRTLRFGQRSQIARCPLDSRSNWPRIRRRVLAPGILTPLEDRGIVVAMTDIGDSLFHKGQDVWVIQGDGSQRAAEYVGEGEISAWFGGAPTAIVVYPDTRSGEAVAIDRIIPR